MNIGKLKLKSTPGSQILLSKPPKKEEKQEMQKIFDEKLKTKDKITTYQPFVGSGMIVSSGTSLVGNDTKFKTQVQNGDCIIVSNSFLQTNQQKQVMVVLGDKSILLKQPFIQQITGYSSYKIQKKTKIDKGQDIGEQFKKKLQQIKKTKQISKQSLDLRIKKGMWAYEKQTVDVKKDASREDLLDIRSKRIKDKFCW